MPLNTKENTNQERCHRCHCVAHCDERLCGNCEQCSECDCWSCLHKRNPAIYDVDLLS